MGNLCSGCVCRQTDDDEAADALLDGFDSTTTSRPRGPPPPYQVEAPLYAMSEEQRVQLVQRVTMIQSLPLGRYDVGEDKSDKEGKLEPSDEVQGREKKGQEERECPICMNDFAVGEPIRLLPCMHFYHMRCIDNWLMRSYSCPSCMERVDIGMCHTLSSAMPPSPAPSQGGVGVRRRRRRGRGERGSSSSIASMLSMGEGSGFVAGGKRQAAGRNGGQFFPPEYAQPSGQAVGASGQASASGQAVRTSGQSPRRVSGHHHHHHHPQYLQGGQMSYLTDQSTSGHFSASSSGHDTTGQTGLGQLEEGASGGSSGLDYDEARVLGAAGGFIVHAESASHEDLAYSMDTMTYSGDYYRPESSSPLPRGNEYCPPQSPPISDDSGMVGVASSGRGASAPYSPPVFEYHFEYPTISHTPSSSSSGHAPSASPVAPPYNQ